MRDLNDSVFLSNYQITFLNTSLRLRNISFLKLYYLIKPSRISDSGAYLPSYFARFLLIDAIFRASGAGDTAS